MPERQPLIMKLLGITDRGLIVISLLVMALWGIIFAERAILRQAQQDHLEFLRTLRETREIASPMPAAHIVPPPPARERGAAELA